MSTTSDEKTFKHYSQIPSEVRMMIIGEMSLNDRWKFSLLSKVCQKEAQKSKDFTFALKLIVSSAQNCLIYVKHGKEVQLGYQLQFRETDDKKYMTYSPPFKKELWRTEFDSSTNLIQLATERFKTLLQMYQKSIKQLTIKGVSINDFGVWSLSNLEKLEMSTFVENILEVSSKGQKHLKEVTYNGEFLGADRYLCQFQCKLDVSYMMLNYEQFQRLSASVIDIHIGEITAADIYHFITTWKNGELRKNFKHCRWYLHGSNFEIEDLCTLLEPRYSRFDGHMIIDHNTEDGKTANVHHSDYCQTLTFDV